MKKLLKVLLVLFALFVLVMGAVYWYFTSESFYKGKVIPAISRATGEPITVDRIRFSPFSGGRIENMTVGDPNQPVMTVGTMRVRASAFALFFGGTLRVKECVLEDAHLVVTTEKPETDAPIGLETEVETTDEHGNTVVSPWEVGVPVSNPPPDFTAFLSGMTTTSQTAEVHIENVSIKNCSMRFQQVDEAGAVTKSFAIQDVACDLPLLRTGHDYAGEFSMNVAIVDVGNDVKVEIGKCGIKISGKIAKELMVPPESSGMEIFAREIEGNLRDMDVSGREFTGTLRFAGKGNSMDWQLAATEVKGDQTFATFRAALTGDPTTGTLAGSANYSIPHDSLFVALPAAQAGWSVESGRLSAKLDTALELKPHELIAVNTGVTSLQDWHMTPPEDMAIPPGPYTAQIPSKVTLRYDGALHCQVENLSAALQAAGASPFQASLAFKPFKLEQRQFPGSPVRTELLPTEDVTLECSLTGFPLEYVPQKPDAPVQIEAGTLDVQANFTVATVANVVAGKPRMSNTVDLKASGLELVSKGGTLRDVTLTTKLESRLLEPLQNQRTVEVPLLQVAMKQGNAAPLLTASTDPKIDPKGIVIPPKPPLGSNPVRLPLRIAFRDFALHEFAALAPPDQSRPDVKATVNGEMIVKLEVPQPAPAPEGESAPTEPADAPTARHSGSVTFAKGFQVTGIDVSMADGSRIGPLAMITGETTADSLQLNAGEMAVRFDGGVSLRDQAGAELLKGFGGTIQADPAFKEKVTAVLRCAYLDADKLQAIRTPPSRPVEEKPPSELAADLTFRADKVRLRGAELASVAAQVATRPGEITLKELTAQVQDDKSNAKLSASGTVAMPKDAPPAYNIDANVDGVVDFKSIAKIANQPLPAIVDAGSLHGMKGRINGRGFSKQDLLNHLIADLDMDVRNIGLDVPSSHWASALTTLFGLRSADLKFRGTKGELHIDKGVVEVPNLALEAAGIALRGGGKLSLRADQGSDFRLQPAFAGAVARRIDDLGVPLKSSDDGKYKTAPVLRITPSLVDSKALGRMAMTYAVRARAGELIPGADALPDGVGDILQNLPVPGLGGETGNGQDGETEGAPAIPLNGVLNLLNNNDDGGDDGADKPAGTKPNVLDLLNAIQPKDKKESAAAEEPEKPAEARPTVLNLLNALQQKDGKDDAGTAEDPKPAPAPEKPPIDNNDALKLLRMQEALRTMQETKEK